jgi:tetratricopeptide (TPR) repeat protein
MLPRPPMLTIKNQVAFKLLLIALVAVVLAGCKPPGAKALLDGQRLLEKGRVPEAIERLETATELLATNAQAWNYLGIACHRAGQWTNAINAYRRARSLDPNLTEVRLNLGALWLELNHPAEAKSEFTGYTLMRPGAPEGFAKLAQAEFGLREPVPAEQHARKALQLDGDDVATWNLLGLIQLQRGRPRDAVQSFTAAVQRQADYGPALLNLAVVLQQQVGDRAGALKCYRQYLELKPRPADADAVLANVRQLELELAPRQVAPPPPPPPISPPAPAQSAPKPVTNVAATRPAPVSAPAPAPAPKPVIAQPAPVLPPPTVVTLPPEPVIQTSAAPATRPSPMPVAVGDSSAGPRPVSSPTAAAPQPEKRSFLERINPLNLFRRESKSQLVTPLPVVPSSPATVREEVVVAQPPPKTAEVAPAAAPPTLTEVAPAPAPRYREQGGGNVQSGDRAAAERFSGKGMQAMRARRFAEASAAFASAAAADPGWFQAHFNHAVAALEAGRVSESLKASEAALAISPDSADARYNFALALKRGNYTRDAAEQLEKLLSANPADARAHLTLGNLYAEQLHQPDRARAQYLKVLELDPKNWQASAIRYWLAANPP